MVDNINGKELTQLYLKSDVILLADVFEKFIKVYTEEYGKNPLYCLSLPGYTYQCALNYTDIRLQTLLDEDLILLIENSIRGGMNSVMGSRFVNWNEIKKMIYINI